MVTYHKAVRLLFRSNQSTSTPIYTLTLTIGVEFTHTTPPICVRPTPITSMGV